MRVAVVFLDLRVGLLGVYLLEGESVPLGMPTASAAKRAVGELDEVAEDRGRGEKLVVDAVDGSGLHAV